jgi:hypothetical protein
MKQEPNSFLSIYRFAYGFGDRLDQLRPIGRLLNVQAKFTAQRLKTACQRALNYDNL